MSIVVYQDVETPIVPVEGLAGRVREALGASLRQMRYVTPDFAGLRQDAAGSAPVTAAEQPVGLMLDRRFGLGRGQELIATPLDFTASPWLGTAAVTLGVKSFSGTTTGTAYATVLTPGKTYEAEVDIASSTAINTRIYNNPGGVSNPLVVPAGSSLPNGRLIFTAVDSSFGIRIGGGGDVSVNSISIRELPGNPAKQATTTARPTLKGSPLHLDFDGVDDVLATDFQSALGSDCTVGIAVPNAPGVILTGQTIGTSHSISQDHAGFIIVDRALTGSETSLVQAWLDSLGAA